ncbi:MAG: hypothetical protein NDI94_03435, partial [Candidatus Woesearchaeota archaeon]|nr:hypothetical protein [Candidatus Woesearchaeota archaeon]
MVSYLEFTPKEFKQGVLEAFDAIYNRKINSPLGFDQENILQEIKDICIKYHSITDRYSYLGLFEENKDNFLFYAYISEFPDGDS